MDVLEVSTPHPLPIALGGLASLLGERTAADLAAFGAVLSFALLVYATFRLGRALGGPAAGIVAAAIVATRPRIDFFASRAFVEVPFAALVLLAAALAAEAPRRNGPRALALLAVAGLLRPEAWALAVVYGAWLVFAGPARRAAFAALALVAPVVWMLFDLALSGDPLYSLHGTQDNVILLERVTGLDQLLPTLRGSIGGLVGLAPALAGAGFGVYGLVRFRRERAAFAVASLVAAAGVCAFALLAAVELPLNDRYLTVPALALVALASAAVARVATAVASRSLPDALVALAVAGALLVPAVASLPGDLAAARESVDGAASKARSDEDLEDLLARPAVRAEIDACPRLLASSSARAPVATLLGRDPAGIAIALSPIPPRGAVALSTSDTVRPGTPGTVRERAWTFVNRC